MNAIKSLFRWVAEKQKIFFAIFSAITLIFFVLHIAFYNQDDKLATIILIPIMPIVIYLGIKLMFKIVWKNATENFFSKLIVFFWIALSISFVTLVGEYIFLFPKVNANAPILVIWSLFEMISEMKRVIHNNKE